MGVAAEETKVPHFVRDDIQLGGGCKMKGAVRGPRLLQIDDN